MKNTDIAKKYLPPIKFKDYCPDMFGLNTTDCDLSEDCNGCWEVETELDKIKIANGLKTLLAEECKIIDRAKVRKDNILECLINLR